MQTSKSVSQLIIDKFTLNGSFVQAWMDWWKDGWMHALPSQTIIDKHKTRGPFVYLHSLMERLVRVSKTKQVNDESLEFNSIPFQAKHSSPLIWDSLQQSKSRGKRGYRKRKPERAYQPDDDHDPSFVFSGPPQPWPKETIKQGTKLTSSIVFVCVFFFNLDTNCLQMCV